MAKSTTLLFSNFPYFVECVWFDAGSAKFLFNFCIIALSIDRLQEKRAFSFRESNFGLCLNCESLVNYS